MYVYSGSKINGGKNKWNIIYGTWFGPVFRSRFFLSAAATAESFFVVGSFLWLLPCTVGLCVQPLRGTGSRLPLWLEKRARF